MNRKATVAVLMIAGLFAASTAFADEGAAASTSTRPPKNLKKVGDHWTPWDPPAAGPNDYIIQQHDTLWDLAGKWLQDPHLWPQVWDQNRYIQDSHWIYPGDPLVVPGKPDVVPPGGPISVTEAPPEEAPSGEEPGAAPPQTQVVKGPPPLVPVADPADLYCSGFIDPSHTAATVAIVGREIERKHVAQGDVVFINQGRNQGMSAGAELAVVRPAYGVEHPITGQNLGSFIKRLGRVRVLATQENTSTAVIEMACEDIVEQDEVVPWGDIPAPMMREMPKFDRYDATPSGGLQGYVVAVRDRVPAVGGGHVIYTDLGAQSGVKPGDLLTLYRDNADLPRLMIGRAVILTVEEGTSTCKVMQAVRELGVGDRVEAMR